MERRVAVNTETIRSCIFGLSFGVVAFFMLHCDGNTNPPPPVDAAVVHDTGVRAECGDAGVHLAGDAAGLDGGRCDPVTGAGCLASEQCVFVPQSQAAECRPRTTTPKAHEAVCDPVAQDCAAGFTCVRFTDDPQNDAICKRTCRPRENAACACLTGTSTSYACGRIFSSGTVAVCDAIQGKCTPLADTCPTGSYCQARGLASFSCEPEGTQEFGQACGVGQNCKKGAMCINLGEGARCYRVCDPRSNTCPLRSACGTITGAGYGVCENPCDLYTNDCPQGRVCQVSSATANACFPLPNPVPTEGSACAPQNICGPTLICVEGMCRKACDATHPCASGTCMPTSIGVGRCG